MREVTFSNRKSFSEEGCSCKCNGTFATCYVFEGHKMRFRFFRSNFFYYLNKYDESQKPSNKVLLGEDFGLEKTAL